MKLSGWEHSLHIYLACRGFCIITWSKITTLWPLLCTGFNGFYHSLPVWQIHCKSFALWRHNVKYDITMPRRALQCHCVEKKTMPNMIYSWQKASKFTFSGVRRILIYRQVIQEYKDHTDIFLSRNSSHFSREVRAKANFPWFLYGSIHDGGYQCLHELAVRRNNQGYWKLNNLARNLDLSWPLFPWWQHISPRTTKTFWRQY